MSLQNHNLNKIKYKWNNANRILWAQFLVLWCINQKHSTSRKKTLTGLCYCGHFRTSFSLLLSYSFSYPVIILNTSDASFTKIDNMHRSDGYGMDDISNFCLDPTGLFLRVQRWYDTDFIIAHVPIYQPFQLNNTLSSDLMSHFSPSLPPRGW